MTQKPEWFKGTQERWEQRQAKTEELLKKFEKEGAKASSHMGFTQSEQVGASGYEPL